MAKLLVCDLEVNEFEPHITMCKLFVPERNI